MKDDMISRQAALGALGERPVVWSDNDDYTLGARNQYDMDRLALETVPSAQQWIPCKTALPEHDGEYLVTKKSFGWNCTGYIETDIARYEKKNGWHKADQVIAWCPLPEPWKGEKP